MIDLNNADARSKWICRHESEILDNLNKQEEHSIRSTQVPVLKWLLFSHAMTAGWSAKGAANRKG